MTGAVVGVLILLVMALSIGLVAAVAKARSQERQPGQPDRASGEVVSGLMDELAKHRAEASYWKATAERLQRELDQRQ